MESLGEFLQSDKSLALMISIGIFLLTIFLVVKRWVNFFVAFLLLIFAITAGLVISQYQIIHNYVCDIKENRDQVNFKKQMIHVMEELESEVEAEQANLRQLLKQVEEIFDQVENEKIKLKQFIEETKERFKQDKKQEDEQTD